MLKIAYCDGKETDRENLFLALTQIEKALKTKFVLFSFVNGEHLCSSIPKNHYDIIFLDILLDGIDGIETASRINNMGEDSLFIFTSNNEERIKELFDYRTIGFLEKPLNTTKLNELISKVLSILSKENKLSFIFNFKGSMQYKPLKEIMYFESKRNQISIHTTKQTEIFYGTLISVWESVKSTNSFIMPHRSFIINLEFASMNSAKIFIKQTGETFNIGNKYKKDTINRYNKFIKNLVL